MALTQTYVGGSVNQGSPGDTIASVPFGTASADRVNVVFTFLNNSSGSSASLGGIAANLYNPAAQTNILSALVPTGTAGAVVLNSSGGFGTYGVWAITGGAILVPDGYAIDASGAGAVSLAVPAGGCLIGVALDVANPGSTPSWAGINNESSQYTTSDGWACRNGGLDSATAQTINATVTGCTFPIAILVAFAPLPAPVAKLYKISQTIKRASYW